MTRLLQDNEPRPYEICNPGGASPLVLTCEHAGRLIPESLGDLGIAPQEMDRHIAYDIGAEEVARRLSVSLNAVLVLQPYSRLVADCNRPREAPDCMPEISDGTTIHANCGLTDADRKSRFDSIHQPFHAQIGKQLDRRQDQAPGAILIAVHSFSPQLRSRGGKRPWHVGLLYNRSDELARQLMPTLGRYDKALQIAYNEPYRIDDESDYTIPVHGERRGIPHVLLEIRNDLIEDAAGQTCFAELLSTVIGHVLKEREVVA